MTRLRAGIVGLGRIASLYEEDEKAKRHYDYLTHAVSYAKHPHVKLVCGSDIDKGRRDIFSDKWKVKNTYSDYRKMLRENELDILSVCTYPDKHKEIIEEASKYVKVIFCEKPFTNSSEEIKDIIKLKNERALKIAINLYRQYDPSHRKIASYLKDGRFGVVQRVNCFYGKGIRNMGSHLLGYLLDILGKPEKTTVLGKKKCADMAGVFARRDKKNSPA